MRRTRPVLSAELILLLGLLALVGLGYLVERWLLSGDSAPIGPVAALAIAAAPTCIWALGLRAHAGELDYSTSALVALFALGAFIAAPAARFAIELGAPQHPLAPAPLAPFGLPRVVVAIGVVGLAYESAKYLAIRYTEYRREGGDSIAILIAATAVALGVAAHDVYRELTSLGAIGLGLGATLAAATSLTHAAVAAIAACALIAARTRAPSPARRAALLAGGVVTAAIAHGALSFAHAALEADGLSARPDRAAIALSLIAAAMLVGLTFAAARLSHRRASERAETGDAPQPA